MSDIIEVLKRKYYQFDFFQAVSLLEEYLSYYVKEPLNSGKLRFIADPSIVFPASDIADFRQSDDASLEMNLSFMGLIGISSPLPQYFVEFGSSEKLESSSLTDFLNIFDNRIYSLFYEAWRKHRLIPTWGYKKSVDINKRINYISGLNLSEQNSQHNYLLAYVGLFASMHRNADGLAEILSDCCGGIKVVIEQWTSRWAEVYNKKELGKDFSIGSEAMLGDKIFDCSGKFNVVVDICESGKLVDFLPGSNNIKMIKEIVMLFCSELLSFDIKVNFAPRNLIPVVLGSNDTQIGMSSSCGKTEDKNGIYSFVIQGRN